MYSMMLLAEQFSVTQFFKIFSASASSLHPPSSLLCTHTHKQLISSGREDFQGLNFRSKRGTVRLRSVFPPGFSKSKNIIKRVEVQMLEFEKLSIRNAKHLYIERCQANPGYDCSFFNVRVPSSGRFKRAPVAKQLMGISNKRILFLDEKTKVRGQFGWLFPML